MGNPVNASGMSARRLQFADDYLQRIVANGEVAGAGGYVARHGQEVYCASHGLRDRERNLPMENDSLYRIYSMTKTFTVAALMTLYERGLFKLHDPIAAFLPCFSSPQVAGGDVTQLVPAQRPLTFWHLLTMTAGIPYPGAESPSARKMAEIGQQAMRDAMAGDPWDTARIVEAAATAPLCFQPGEHWLYGFSHDVLGRLIEVLSGRRLGAYMAEVLFEPLGLRDTSFYVTPDRRHRLVKPYAWSPTGGLAPLTEFLSIDPAVPSPFESGGGGLASTLRDVGRFGQMLLGGGQLDGQRVLSRKTVDLIRQNHLSPELLADFSSPAQAGYGYGLGVRTLLDKGRAGLNGSLGEWAWDGMLGTWYAVDPQEDLVVVFLIQRAPGGNDDLPKRFAQTVYAAIDD